MRIWVIRPPGKVGNGLASIPVILWCCFVARLLGGVQEPHPTELPLIGGMGREKTISGWMVGDNADIELLEIPGAAV